ncbi:MAG TPA: nucleotidyltransferase [Pseudothermotoga sp.]|nr:nucleotidyltransferase [Pseudothermotoga sp.]HOK84135.1 nucleotidyltransferase [Pseudothermotoga sp.]HPP69134.1 nucleotidyltransferase [Pseudothermotoga sp.]
MLECSQRGEVVSLKVLGIVVEYNPFHNGHLYHLNRAKEIVKPDYTVAVMSGNFCQRGEPAIIDKFSRAQVALLSGVDVVFELPFVYAIQDAGGFAKGAVGLLERTRVVTDIVFGSESANIDFLTKIATIMIVQPEPFPRLMKEELKKGHSFPNARKYALLKYFELTKEMDPKEVLKIEKSNDILGVEYIKSLKELKSDIKVHVIKRVGAEDKDADFKGKFSSATAIRKMIIDGQWDKVTQAVPETSLRIISRELNEGRGPVSIQQLEQIILAKIRLMRREELQKLYGFSEGIDLRFVHCASKFGELDQFLSCIKAKRFTMSKIRRLMLYALFNISQEFLSQCNESGPQYLRVLGFSSKGRQLLSVIKRRSSIPVLSVCSLYKKVLQKVLKDKTNRFTVDQELFEKQLLLDVQSTSIHSLLFPNKSERSADRDFHIPPIIVG